MYVLFVFYFSYCTNVKDILELTQSLNKGQKNHTMVRELSMVQVAQVGPYQAQLTHIQCWGHWGPCWGCGGAQSQKMGYF